MQVAAITHLYGVLVIYIVQCDHGLAAPRDELTAMHLLCLLLGSLGSLEVAVPLAVGVVEVHLGVDSQLDVPPLGVLALAVHVVLLAVHVVAEGDALERPLSIVVVLEQKALGLSRLLAVACQVSVLVCGQVPLLWGAHVHLLRAPAVLQHPHLRE